METKCCIILLHAGNEHPCSKKCLDAVIQSGLKGITCIHINDEKTKQYLRSNERGIIINELPCYLITEEKGLIRKTREYSHFETETVLDFLKEINGKSDF